MFNNFAESHVIYEIMWENMAQPDKPQITVQKTHALCMLDK
jgi:hypothetical protein